MSDFRTHVTVSTALGIGYTGVGVLKGLPIESALIAGGLCGVSGMLPDIDSDSGIPLRETMSFSAAIVPVMLLGRFQEMGFSHDQIVLAAGATYLFVRFAITRLLSRYTVHRGMFHSIPAILIFTGIAFLVSGSDNLQLRYFKAGGVLIGSLSHLLMDELNSIEWRRGRWRFKKSFGTALKLWGKSGWANFSAYAKLTIVVLLILSEPSIMNKYGQYTPIVVNNQAIRERLRGQSNNTGEPLLIESSPTTPYATIPYSAPQTPPPRDEHGDPIPLVNRQPEGPPRLGRDRTIYDTAKRIWKRWVD